MTGSVTLVRSLLQAGLLDELDLMVHPIVLQFGKRLFDDVTAQMPLELVRSETFKTGVISAYVRAADRLGLSSGVRPPASPYSGQRVWGTGWSIDWLTGRGRAGGHQNVPDRGRPRLHLFTQPNMVTRRRRSSPPGSPGSCARWWRSTAVGDRASRRRGARGLRFGASGDCARRRASRTALRGLSRPDAPAAGIGVGLDAGEAVPVEGAIAAGR